MPIDLKRAVGAEFPEVSAEWGADQVILYHLGLGAGLRAPTDPAELAYTYEKALKVLPSYAVVPVFGALAGLAGVDGVSINFALVLHGEQDIVIHRPIPTAARIVSKGRIADVYDKGKAALILIEVESSCDGEPLFTNRFSVFARGEGGFGGEPGPKPGNLAPEREPDLVVECPTLPNQALLYRLSGDKNPLHADPEFAKLGGFDTPILHGLCSYGIVCKAAVDGLLGGDVARVARYQARFAGVVFPGETIVVSMWQQDGQVILSARTNERDTPVISNCAITTR